MKNTFGGLRGAAAVKTAGAHRRQPKAAVLPLGHGEIGKMKRLLDLLRILFSRSFWRDFTISDMRAETALAHE